ncbi:MAG: serine--tRNA ligase [Alphaproteobacteria bacterium]|nr:serine--tRNA ligase [Alphaproteobacteria bacterium]
MLDIKFIRENPGIVKEAIKNKGIALDLNALLKADKELAALRQRGQDMATEKNRLTLEIKAAADKAPLKEKARLLGERQGKINKKLKDTELALAEMMALTPQIPAPNAPIGLTDADNTVLRQVGKKPDFGFEPLDHVDLIQRNNWGEFGKITNVCGTRTFALKGSLLRYEFALLQYALDKLAQKGFTTISVPSLAMEDAFFGSGHFPGDKENMYFLPKDGQYLSGTCEIVLNSLHCGEILTEARLPILYAGFSPCFRREAGSAGRDARGLYRVHQFNKVEQFVICRNDPEESAKWHAFLLAGAEEILAGLELPYRVVECCTGDMGAGKVRMNDIECWRPALQKYGETHSCSTLHDWQARRTNTRYRENLGGKVKFVHTLNNTALATPRIFVALLENHQTRDARVRIPKAIRPFMGDAEFL